MRLSTCDDYLPPEWEAALHWGGEIPRSQPWISTKALHCSNKPFAVLVCFYSFPSQVERLVMRMSAHQVPAMDNNPKAFLGSSLKGGWIPRQFPRCSPLPSIWAGPGSMLTQSSWSLASASPCSVLFCHPLPHTIHSSHTEVPADAWRCPLWSYCICLYGSSWLEPGCFLLMFPDWLSIYPN